MENETFCKINKTEDSVQILDRDIKVRKQKILKNFPLKK